MRTFKIELSIGLQHPTASPAPHLTCLSLIFPSIYDLWAYFVVWPPPSQRGWIPFRIWGQSGLGRSWRKDRMGRRGLERGRGRAGMRFEDRGPMGLRTKDFVDERWLGIIRVLRIALEAAALPLTPLLTPPKTPFVPPRIPSLHDLTTSLYPVINHFYEKRLLLVCAGLDLLFLRQCFEDGFLTMPKRIVLKAYRSKPGMN